MFTRVTQESHRFDELTTLQFGWDFTASQLAAAQEASSVSLYQTADIAYNRFRLNAAYDQSLYVREGFVSFGLLEPDNPTTCLYDQVIPNSGLIVFPREDHMQAVSPVGFRGNGVHFSCVFLERLLQPIYQRSLDLLLPPAGIYLPDRQKLIALRAELRKWQQLVAYGADRRAAIVSRREESLALAVFDALNEAGYSRQQTAVKKSERSMSRALELVHGSDLTNISALELCKHAGCSQRTLENTFLTRFGVTPKKYIKCLRLARVHRELRQFDSSDGASIIELAGVHGFWHMGQFAADYRRIYGELPSDTLRRGRAGALRR